LLKHNISTMSIIHFLNVLEGDCNIIQHDSGRISVIDISNAYDEDDTPEETAVRNSQVRHLMQNRTMIPSNKKDYQQKKSPDNPIEYLKNAVKTREIFRFVVTHPDMDHLDGIKDLFNNFNIACFWDTNNKKELTTFYNGGYNKADWDFYKDLRDKKVYNGIRRSYVQGDIYNYFNLDYLTILAPTKELVDEANRTGNYNDSSFVLLYEPPRGTVGNWKIVFAGDSEDKTWETILNNDDLKRRLTNVDILFAPHHGRDSGRSYKFLDVLEPLYTLLGNASSEHLAYNCYPKTRITNNQAGYIILNIETHSIGIYVKNFEFARDFRSRRNYSEPVYNPQFNGYLIEVYFGR